LVDKIPQTKKYLWFKKQIERVGTRTEWSWGILNRKELTGLCFIDGVKTETFPSIIVQKVSKKVYNLFRTPIELNNIKGNLMKDQ